MAVNFIRSQAEQRWVVASEQYDDGGISGGTMERPALQKLLRDVEAGKIDVVVVYKIDRLSRSLFDFLSMIRLFDQRGVIFVSVTQNINSGTPMGRLMLNVLQSFAQFEMEQTGERIRDICMARGKACSTAARTRSQAEASTASQAYREGELSRIYRTAALAAG